MYLAIDPGKDTGWALFGADGALRRAGLGAPPGPVMDAALHAIIELPQVYRASLSKGDPNDLIKVAVQVGEYKANLERGGCIVKLFLPAEWKGQVTKDICEARARRALSPAEEVIVTCAPCAESKRHNIWDAVAMGLWALGRITLVRGSAPWVRRWS